MTPSTQELQQQIQKLGLCDRARMEAVFADSDALSTEPARDLRQLIDAGLLTEFQAKVLLAGRGERLQIGAYLIEEPLGEGGMGKVYRARHSVMDRIVAVKVLSKNVIRNEATLKRFLREIKVVAQLNHPHIVSAFDANQHNGVPYLVLEYIAGDDLQKLVETNGPYSVEQTLDLILQAAVGLEYAHSRQIIHRDIKPANLLLSEDGVVKILDLGLARTIQHAQQAEDAEGLSESGIILGTADYMSPEQAIDLAHVDVRSDIYSLGCTLFFLLTQRPMFPEDSSLKKLLAHRDQQAPSLMEVCRLVPLELEAVYFKMTAKNPAERFSTMTEVIEALEGVQQSLTSETGPPALISLVDEHNASPVSAAYAQRQAQRRQARSIALGVLVVVCIGVFAVQMSGSGFFDQFTNGDASKKPTTQKLPVLNSDNGDQDEPQPREQQTGVTGMALDFDGKSRVLFPEFAVAGNEPLTVEVAVTPRSPRRLGGVLSHFVGTEGWFLGLSNNRWAISFSRNEAPLSRIGSISPVRWGEEVILGCVLDGNSVSLYVDGELQSEAFVRDATHLGIAKPFRLGAVEGLYTIDFHYFDGRIHGLRLSRGNRFADPENLSNPWELDDQTEALYLFREGRGAVLHDSSAHERHGQIEGAKWVSRKQPL